MINFFHPVENPEFIEGSEVEGLRKYSNDLILTALKQGVPLVLEKNNNSDILGELKI